MQGSPTTAAPHDRRRTLVGVLAIALLVVALRAPALADPLGIDEGGMSLIGADWLRGAASGTHGSSLYGDHWIDRPPLLLALYGTAQVVAGALGVRLLGMLATLAACALAGLTARQLAGRSAAGWIAAASTACVLSMPSVDGDRTTGELLAAAPAAGALALLALVARRDGLSRWNRAELRLATIAGAGCVAACAPLVKQSALDAFVAAAAWGAWRAARGDLRGAVRDLALFTTAAVLTAACVVFAAGAGGVRLTDLQYAMFGFRIDVLAALDAQTLGPTDRISRLLGPAAASGLLLLAIVTPAGIRRTVRGPAGGAGAALLAGWLVGAFVGVAGGGYYWAHYLLQLCVPFAVACGIALARRSIVVPALLVTLLALAATGERYVRASTNPPTQLTDAGYVPTDQADALAVAGFVRRNSAPDDRIAMIYARANVPYLAEREPATPYGWSSMYRTLPEARTQLLRALTGPDRAAWVVAWQRPTAFGVDRDGAVRRALRRGYRHVATICGKRILVRTDRRLPGIVLPAQRCRRMGPEQVLAHVPVTRGFDTA